MRTERSAEVERQNTAAGRYASGSVQKLIQPAPPAAVYDTVTEGMLGWRFLRTWRWFGFIVGALLFAVACGLLSNWQFDRGQNASADNDTVSANWAADPVPIAQALPTLASYDPSQSWQRVSVSGTYAADGELFVRNRSNGGANGFEVLTPLTLDNGATFLVDRGWVAPSATDALAPAPVPRPTSGVVDVEVQLRPSETPQGTASPAGEQIASIALPRLQSNLGGGVYTGAYGVLVGQSPAAEPGLAAIQTTAPLEDVGVHYSYAVQWLAFALIGFIGLGLGARAEYRRLNSEDPEERERAAERLQKRAQRAFTDEELEDEAIDGFLPLTRWGHASALSVSASLSPARAALPRVPSPADVPSGDVEAVRPREGSDAPDVFVLEPSDTKP